MTKDQEITGFVVLIVIVVLLYLGHNFLGSIKTAPISLVPQGQAQAQVAAASAQTALAATQQQQYNAAMYSNMYAANQTALAAQQQAAYSGLGAGLGNLAASIANSMNGYNYDEEQQ